MTETPPSAAVLRGDMQAMHTYIQGARIVSMARETEISRIKAWLIYRFWSGVAIAAVALFVINIKSFLGVFSVGNAALISALVLLILSSRLGAIVSIGRRMTTDNLGATVGGDSIYTLAVLGSGKSGFALGLLSSNVFGLVMFAFFASGIPSLAGLKGGIIPDFTAVDDNRLRDDARDEVVRTAERAAEARAGLCSATQTTAPTPASTPAQTPTPTPKPPPTPAPAPGQKGPNVTVPDKGGATAPASVPNADCAERKAAEQIASKQAKAAVDHLQALATPVELKSSLLRSRSSCACAGDATWPERIRQALGLASIPDLFKMLLWAFVAGFFEQLVPDMLNNLNARAIADKRQGESPAR